MPELPLAICVYYVRHRPLVRREVLNNLGQQTAYTMLRVVEGAAHIPVKKAKLIAREGQVLLARPGDCIHINKGSRVSYMCFDIVARSRQYLSGNDGHIIVQVDQRTKPQPAWSSVTDVAIPRLLPAEWARSARTVLDDTYDWYYRSWPELNRANTQVQSWLLDVMQSLQAREEDRPGQVNDAELLATVRNMACTGLSIGAIAESLGMSRATLYRHLGSLSDRSPGDMLTALRIERACTILRKHDYAIQSVARMAGFTDPSAFARRFKHIHGISPSKWRSLHRS